MEVCLNNRVVSVKVVRKNNKNIYFRFDKDLNLVVTANRFVSLKEIERLIIKNTKSLANMLIKLEQKQVKENEFWYLGNKYNVIFDEKEDLEFDCGVIKCRDEVTLSKFLKKQTIEIFNDEILKMRQIIKTPDFSLKIRKMKTRWGVCNYKNMTITLNSELIKYRKDLLRYVIVHEMCHFYQHNHGPLFWQMVAKYYPNYKEARKELRS